MRGILAFVLVACGNGSGALEVASNTVDEGEIDRYEPEHLTRVRVTMDESDWYDLSHEQPNTLYEMLLGPECFEEPRASGFSWFSADVSIDEELLMDVGVRKKGFLGSMSWSRPSLKLDSDRWLAGQKYRGDSEHFTINNNKQDTSRVHTCLAYSLFRAAGVPAPRCAFATVEVNDEPLGVYSNVQPIKRQFLLENFGNDDGDLYEGTLSDLHSDWLATFEIKSEGSNLGPLQEVADILAEADSNPYFLSDLEQVLDVDGFIREWAVETLIGHWDGYAGNRNNYYVYHDPADGLLKFIPWGADATFENPSETPFFAMSNLTMRLWNSAEGRLRYLNESQRLLDEVWDEDWLFGEVDRMESLITPHLLEPQESGAALDGVRDFVSGRRAAMEAVIAFPPEHDFFEHEKMCIEPLGSLSIAFETEWDTLDHENVFLAYPSIMEGELEQLGNWSPELYNEYVGAQAGFGEEGPVLAVLGVDTTAEKLTVAVLFLPGELRPGNYSVDVAAVPGFVYSVDLARPESEPEYFYFMGGEVNFEAIDFSSGARVSGSLEALLLPPFW